MNRMDEMGMEMPRRITMPLCDRTVSTEVSADYTLPDYQPEIRRLLYVKPTVLPPAKYVGGSNVELNGTVDYQALYVGADGGLYSVPLSAEYNLNVPFERAGEFDLNEGVTVFATTVSENMSTRVGGPRKLSVRCRLRSHVRAYGKMIAEESFVGTVDPASIRRKRLDCRNMWVAGGVSDMIGMSEEILGTGDDVRVISADATVFVKEARAGEGIVDASGDVLLKIMTGREGSMAETLLRKIPFEGEIEVEGMTAGGACRVMGTVSELSVNVEEGRILCDVGILLEARGMYDLPMSYTADLYSTERECECAFASYDLPIALKCENGNVSQSERIPLEQANLPEGATTIDAWGSVQFESCEQTGDKYVLNGQSRYVLLCEKDGEYSTAELTLPLRYETSGGNGAPVTFDGMGEMIACRTRVDGECLNLDAELSVIADFVGEENIRMVSEARFGEPLDCRGNRMIVYYPTCDDNSWTVAKKYHVSPEAISEGAGYYFF